MGLQKKLAAAELFESDPCADKTARAKEQAGDDAHVRAVLAQGGFGRLDMEWIEPRRRGWPNAY